LTQFGVVGFENIMENEASEISILVFRFFFQFWSKWL